MKLTFKRGVYLKGKKGTLSSQPFEIIKTGEKVFIPLTQHNGKPAKAVVKAGDIVKVGTLIGKASGSISANVHSSVSGKVLGIQIRENICGIKVRHIAIENDGKFTEDFLPPLDNPTPQEIVERCKDAGLVGMGGATFPTHIKLQPKNKIDTLVINGAECEPYISVDNRMMIEFPKEIMEGIGYLKKALNAGTVKIGVEDNKPKAIEALSAEINDPDTKIYKLKTKYPQGGERQLIYALCKRTVPDCCLPTEVGVVVFNISTAYAVYEAIRLGKPSFSRYLTVSGKGIKKPANVLARIGTPFEEIIEQLGSTGDYVQVVVGGPMMGTSISNLRPTVTKGSTSLLLLNEKEIRRVDPSPCINCARCHSVCPVNLMPMKTDEFVLADKLEEAEKYHPMSCIECGCCAYVCPAKRPLVQSQRLAKKLIREKTPKK